MAAPQPQREVEFELTHEAHWGKAQTANASAYVRRHRGHTTVLIDDGPGNAFTLALTREAELALRAALDLAACPHHDKEMTP